MQCGSNRRARGEFSPQVRFARQSLKHRFAARAVDVVLPAVDQLGVQPGAEFRAAAEAAAAVPGAQCCLVLGDRPIEITLSRAWEALSWQRRFQLLGDLVLAGTASSSQVCALLLLGDDVINVGFVQACHIGPHGLQVWSCGILCARVMAAGYASWCQPAVGAKHCLVPECLLGL